MREAGRTRLLATLLTGQFMANVDTAIANVAAPSIRGTLRASDVQLELVISGYVFAYGVFLMAGARLGDLFGFRRVFAAGLAVFTLASAACGLAPGAGALIAARVVAGAGAAFMVAQVLLGIQRSFSGDARARAIGLYALTLSGSAVVGQIAGGMLVWANLFGAAWRPAFLVNVPVGAALALALALGARRRAERPAAPARDRVVRALLLPLRLEVFRVPAVGWGLVALATSFTTYAALLFVIALFLQEGLGESAAASGFAMVSWVAAFGAGGFAVSRLSQRATPRAAPAGFALLALAFGGISAATLAERPSSALLVALLALGGLGFGGRSALVTHLTRSIDGRYAADLSGLIATSSPVAGALGVALFGGGYLALAPHGAGRAFAATTAAFAVTAALAAIAAYRSAAAARTG